MGELEQCIDVIELTSHDWGERRIAMVAHSYRVMSKARCYDELIVGIMHHGYAYSDYTRGLFDCDVDYEYEWKESLDLLVERTPKAKSQCQDIEEWTSENCKWTPSYKKRLERIGLNRLARNVLIYDLEDTLEMLNQEGISKDEVDKCHAPLIYSLSDDIKNKLIDKYTRALALLRIYRDGDSPHPGDYTDEECERISKKCMKWYGEWINYEEFEMMCEDCGDGL